MNQCGSSQPYDYQAHVHSQLKHQEHAEVVVTSYTTDDAPAASSGYVGKNPGYGMEALYTAAGISGTKE